MDFYYHTSRGARRSNRASKCQNPCLKPFISTKFSSTNNYTIDGCILYSTSTFDIKHIRDDLHLSGLADPKVYALALSQGRIILTKNVKDFRPLLQEDSPGIIGIPETWSTARLDTALMALFMRHGPNYFRGQFRPLSAPDTEKQAA